MREAATDLLDRMPEGTNITDLLVSRQQRNPTLPLYAVKRNGAWTDITAAELHQQVSALAKGLINAGIEPGDRIAVMSKTRYEWTLVDLAGWYAGAVVVPIYETSSPHQVQWILSDSGAKSVFVEDEAKAGIVEKAMAELPEPLPVWTMAGAGSGLAELQAKGADVTDDDLEQARTSRTLADPASLVYTSGTTGRPKGCIITHGNFAELAVNTTEFLPEILKEPGAKSLMFLPLAHVLARAVQVICLTAGVKMGHTANMGELIEDLGSYNPTFLLVVPRVFEKVYATARQKAEDGGKGRIFDAAAATAIAWSKAVDAESRGEGIGPSLLLKAKRAVFNRLVYAKLRAAFGGQVGFTVSGASALSPQLAHFFTGIGVPVLEGYGLTESTAPATVNLPGRNKIGTVGLPLPGTTVRIADDGEVLIKGIGITPGYHNNAEADRDSFVDGFFRTGDLGRLDDDGFLTITGRKKDLLVTAGGKNVAPGPLEDALREHLLVAQAVVVGEGKPFVAALLGLDSEGLARWCRTHGKEQLDLGAAAADTDVLAELQRAVDHANRLVSRAEQLRKFTVLPLELTEASGHMTPSLKLKRNQVIEDFGDAIESLYAK
ncbi:AMP-dependent synthetase and ligase [Arthrobacter crystallopoietes BAB-32]|uniref:Acyl-CoA synthetase n=1 Tax=Arthrobacter crystallopoietes BAB-32 TaxID=1246476 RepID=N1UYK3_9MICC|nr:AMP-dependent synthetase/ligase [Arthrobacter crystallopoietes]EMY34140.1 AMP-dependent synthetase and ligase [Arthrobacter crystallopoietes BAB-32]